MRGGRSGDCVYRSLPWQRIPFFGEGARIPSFYHTHKTFWPRKITSCAFLLLRIKPDDFVQHCQQPTSWRVTTKTPSPTPKPRESSSTASLKLSAPSKQEANRHLETSRKLPALTSSAASIPPPRRRHGPRKDVPSPQDHIDDTSLDALRIRLLHLCHNRWRAVERDVRPHRVAARSIPNSPPQGRHPPPPLPPRP